MKISGSTGCVVLIANNIIYTANIGDSRAVINNNHVAIALSDDHKPYKKIEKDRIEKAGHFVKNNRVDGVISLSRAFGDIYIKNRDDLKP